MKTKNAIMSLVLVAMLLFAGCGGEEKTLTVTQVEILAQEGNPPVVTVIDNNGNVEVLPGNLDDWFTNATLDQMYLEDADFEFNSEGQAVLTDDGYYDAEFIINNVLYYVQIRNGTEFKVKPYRGGYAVTPGSGWERIGYRGP